MTRLIDADALLEAFKKQGYVPAIVEDLITNAPTIEDDSCESKPFTYLAFYSYDDGLERIEGFEEVDKYNSEGFPVYTSPPKREWKSLSDEDIALLKIASFMQDGIDPVITLAKTIEEKLKELNHG